jgi:hypothetical protein
LWIAFSEDEPPKNVLDVLFSREHRQEPSASRRDSVLGYQETEARAKTVWRRIFELFEEYIKYMPPCH